MRGQTQKHIHYSILRIEITGKKKPSGDDRKQISGQLRPELTLQGQQRTSEAERSALFLNCSSACKIQTLVKITKLYA